MREFFAYFFGKGTEIEFTNFSLAHFLPILIATGLIYVIYRFRKPILGWKHEQLLRYILAFALIIRACLNGLKNGTELPPEADFNTFTASQELLEGYKKLPSSLGEAFSAAAGSEFIRQFIPASVIDAYGR